MTQRRKALPPKAVNHRTRVGVERREKTRLQLLQGAMLVFANNGVDASVIDLIIKNAGVSRGTFYNYFRTGEELFFAVSEEVSSELIRIVEPIVQQQSDPAARIACGVSLVVKLARSYPIFAQFVLRGGPPAATAGCLATEVMPADIDAGMRSGRFSIQDASVAFDMVLGPVLMAFNTILTVGIADSYPQELARAILQSLGVTKAMAAKFAARDFGDIDLPAESFLAQVQERAFSG